MENDILTVKGAAGVLGVSTKTIYRMIKARKIPYFLAAGSTAKRIRRQDLLVVPNTEEEVK